MKCCNGSLYRAKESMTWRSDILELFCDQNWIYTIPIITQELVCTLNYAKILWPWWAEGHQRFEVSQDLQKYTDVTATRPVFATVFCYPPVFCKCLRIFANGWKREFPAKILHIIHTHKHNINLGTLLIDSIHTHAAILYPHYNLSLLANNCLVCF